MKTDSKEFEGGSVDKLCFSEKDIGNVWMGYMVKIMNEENDWDCNVEVDTVDGLVVCVSREKVLQALNEIKTGNVPEPWKYHWSLLKLAEELELR